jgi:hypothetical protein
MLAAYPPTSNQSKAGFGALDTALCQSRFEIALCREAAQASMQH